MTAQIRARCLSAAGSPFDALQIFANGVLPRLDDLPPDFANLLDHDIVQGVQSAKESSPGNTRHARDCLAQLRSALMAAHRDNHLERAVQAAFTWSPDFAPSPGRPSSPATVHKPLPVAPTQFPTISLGPLVVPRLFCGLWQLSGPGWGTASAEAIRTAMGQTVREGFTAFDLADHYGDAEIILVSRVSQSATELTFCTATGQVSLDSVVSQSCRSCHQAVRVQTL